MERDSVGRLLQHPKSRDDSGLNQCGRGGGRGLNLYLF